MSKANIVILDAETLGSDMDLNRFEQFGNLSIFSRTALNERIERVKDAHVVITNKVLIDSEILRAAKD